MWILETIKCTEIENKIAGQSEGEDMGEANQRIQSSRYAS
jgi:hypothetical protein